VPRCTSGNFSAETQDFVLDRTLFHVIDSEETEGTSSVPEKMRHLSTLDSEEPSFYIAWKERQRAKYGEDWTPVPVNLVSQEPSEPERDHLAEFEEWLATTDSIEIVG